jgi:hypothetical protein
LRCADVERDIVDAELEGEHVVDLGEAQAHVWLQDVASRALRV